MSTATMKTKTQEAPASKRRGKTEKKSPWAPIVIFLIFAGLVAFMFSPNLPDSQRSGSDSEATSGFANGLSK
jgi:hypothetical protein